MNAISKIKIWDIHGGIHPEENKTQSNQQPINFAGIPDEIILPVSQHIGAPATPIVQVGDKVLKGQMIAKAKGFVSVPVHASTSGEVTAIEHRTLPHPSGMSGECIVIKSDGKDQWCDHQGLKQYQALTKTDLLEHIRQAGIAGMGGAGFPSAVKLATDKTIETLIINGTECEPYITADDVLIRERANEIIAGIAVLEHLINPQSIKIGIEDNKPEAIAALKQAAENTTIQVVIFPTKYPSGGEKQLIQILTGKEVPSGGLPADIGIVCQNIGTTVAIHRAIHYGEPLISRITTITGDACSDKKNLEVLLGTPIQFLLDQCGFEKNQCSRLIMGGPMMGFTLESAATPVVKTTNCILAPNEQELPTPSPAQACIRCGICAEACPASLLPQQMYWFARGGEWEKLEAHNLMDCIECGACSYVCPSNIPLVQYYRASKVEIHQQKQSALQAEQSKVRFEARQERIERQEAEKEAKRKARKKAAETRATENATGKDNGDPILAAIKRAKAKKAAADPAHAAIEKEKTKRADGEVEAPDKITLEKIESPDDAAQQAIIRALQKREAASSMTDTERLENAVTSLQKRIDKATKKLVTARKTNDENLSIFESSLTKLEEKLTDAKQVLADHHAGAKQ